MIKDMEKKCSELEILTQFQAVRTEPCIAPVPHLGWLMTQISAPSLSLETLLLTALALPSFTVALPKSTASRERTYLLGVRRLSEFSARKPRQRRATEARRVRLLFFASIRPACAKRAVVRLFIFPFIVRVVVFGMWESRDNDTAPLVHEAVEILIFLAVLGITMAPRRSSRCEVMSAGGIRTRCL